MAFDEQGQADTVERKINDLQALVPAADRDRRVPAEDIIFDPNIFAVATGIEQHDRYALDFIEATARDPRRMPARAGQRRRQQRLVLVPRQRSGARGHALGLPVPRDPRRHDDGHRQRGSAGDLRGHRAGTARTRRGRRCSRAAPDATERLLEIASRFKGEAGQKRAEDLRLARLAGAASGSSTRSSRASTSSSSRTPTRRAWNSASRCS